MLLINHLVGLVSSVVICVLMISSHAVMASDLSLAELDLLHKNVLMDRENTIKKAKDLYLKAKKDKKRHDELEYLYRYTLVDFYTGVGKKLLNRVNKGIKLAESINEPAYLAGFYVLRSKVYVGQGDENKARSSIKKAILLAQNNLNTKQEFTFKLHLADIFMQQYNANRALQLVLEAYKFFEQESHDYEMAISLKHIAGIYENEQQWDKAIEYYLRALKLNSFDKRGYVTAVIYLNIAQAYQQVDEFENSDKYLNKALKVFDSLQLFSGMGDVYFHQAKNKTAKLEFIQAIELYNKATINFNKKNQKDGVFYSHIGLAFAYGELNNFSDAQEHIKRAKGLYKKHENKSYEIALLEAEKHYSEKQGKFRKAYQLYQQLEILKNTFKENKNKQVLRKLQSSFDGEIKQKENELLMKENKLQKAIIIEQKLSIYLQVTLLIFFCVVLGLMFYIQLKTKRNNKVLMQLTLTDSLTGVANRRSIMSAAKEEFERAQRYKHDLTIGVIDLDFFKRINDSYGHGEGDKVLKAFCRITEENIRLQDKLGRFGGEEFIVIFPHTDINEIDALIKRISTQLRLYSLPDAEHKVTFSIGVTKKRTGDESVDDMIKRADEAVYKAKEQGRDRLVEC